MRIRPYRLSQLTVDDFTLAGYSVAGEETVILAPELDCVFDIGKCPREALTMNHVLLTHGHADHAAGLMYYFAQRDFQGMPCATALVPEKLVGPLKELIRAWGRVEGNTPPCNLVGVRPGDDYEIRRGLVARAFATRHVTASVGFSLIDVRHKLKDEHIGKTGPEIVALKNAGQQVTRRVEVPLVAYLGDTARANYADMPEVRDAKALLIECTFFDDDHRKRARLGKHLHVDDLPEVLEGMNNERIIIVHVTRRTNLAVARKILRRTLPKDLHERVTFLMNRQHISDE